MNLSHIEGLCCILVFMFYSLQASSYNKREGAGSYFNEIKSNYIDLILFFISFPIIVIDHDPGF